MKFKMHGDSVLVEILNKEDYFPRSKILKIDTTPTDPTKHTYMTNVGRVFAVGPGVRLADGTYGEYLPKVGDVVLFSDTPMDLRDIVHIDCKPYVMIGIGSIAIYGIEK